MYASKIFFNVYEQLEENDRLIGMMLDNLKKFKIYEHINIIITSDHGMTSKKPNCEINASMFLNMSLIEIENKTIFGQVSHIYPKPGWV